MRTSVVPDRESTLDPFTARRRGAATDARDGTGGVKTSRGLVAETYYRFALLSHRVTHASHRLALDIDRRRP